MKRLAILAVAALAVGAATTTTQAASKKMSDLKVYINPGHGGYTSNDRPIRIYPFEQNDTNGYWESKSNLYKGLHMYHILDSLGAKPYLSRTKNTEADDRSLSGIAQEANNLGCDIFFSIHSNAGEDVNYPLMLYRENERGVPRYAENVTISKLLWKNLHSSKLAVWTRDTEYISGDLTFYWSQWQTGLGVLRTLYVPGLLSEGGMHEHRPEAHRLMNDDYWWLEAWHFVRTIMEFYEMDQQFVTGNVAGIVYDNHNLREKDMPVTFHNYGRDTFAPINKATVELRDKAGNVVQKRTTDDMYNGVFVFRNVAPGDYDLYTAHGDYYAEVKPVTVTANEVTYQDMPLTMRREFPLEITSYSPAVEAGTEVSCASTIDFVFNTDVDTEAFEKAFTIEPAVAGYFTYSDTYHKASFVPNVSLEPNVTYTVTVSTDAKTPDGYYASPNLAAPLQFSFATRGRSRLELLNHFPADGGVTHYVSPTFEFRFDKSINSSNIYDMLTVTDSKGVALTPNKRSCKFNQLSNDYGNAIIVMTANLTPGEKYHVHLNGELRDRENLPIGSDVDFDFTAIDATADNPEATVFQNFEDACDFAYDPANTTGIGTVLPTAVRSTSVKLMDKAAGRFGYKFTDNHDGQIVWQYTGESAQFNPGDVIGMYVYGDFNDHELWVGLSSGTNKKYTKLCDLDFMGWQYKEVRLDNLEEDFAPFLFTDIKLVQTKSNITQNGYFGIDDIAMRAGDAGVDDITVDAVQGPATIHTIDGRLVPATSTTNLAPGIYLITRGSKTQKFIVIN